MIEWTRTVHWNFQHYSIRISFYVHCISLPFCLPKSSATFCSSQEDKSSGSSPLGQSCSKSLRFASRSSFCFCRNVFVSIFQTKCLMSQCATPLCLALYIPHKIASTDRNVLASMRCFFGTAVSESAALPLFVSWWIQIDIIHSIAAGRHIFIIPVMVMCNTALSLFISNPLPIGILFHLSCCCTLASQHHKVLLRGFLRDLHPSDI